MENIINQKKLIYSDVKGNNNKFWSGTLLDNANVILEWGRIGAKKQKKIKEFNYQGAAEDFFYKKVEEKRNKGYSEIDLINPKQEPIILNKTISEIAKEQIKSDNITIKLIERLSEENKHNILDATTLEYQEDTGLFSTPLGIITSASINKARSILDNISTYVIDKNFENEEYYKLLNSYLRLIPQKVGYKLNPKTLYQDLEDIRKQNDILDSLEVSYDHFITGEYKNDLENTKKKSKPDIPIIFECEIKSNNDNTVFNYINKLYKKTKGKHSASHLNVANIYDVKIKNMENDFNTKGKKIGNIKELWHGTKTSNLLSIMKSGLIIPPKNSPNVTGRMFGNGIYFSDQSTKALNYSYGYWSGTKNNNCFMFLADVAMGKSYIPKNSSEYLPKDNYNSTFAKANKSGVYNNEMIVYNLHQINLKYLIEFI